MVEPLCLIQARLASTRLPNKMLLPIHGKPVLWWAWDRCQRRIGIRNVVIACPIGDVDPIQAAVVGAWVYGWPGDVNDVLGRLYACAHHFRSAPETEILRVTPDDWPIDLERETCTLAQLDTWHATVKDAKLREHIGLLYPKRIELNTLEDYEAVKARYV